MLYFPSMKYAIIAISGSQYKIEEGQVITVDNQNLDADKKNTLTNVLLVVNDTKTEIGTPYVKNCSVEYQIVNNYQGEKLKVYKFKAKSRYRKTQGFRAQLTDIKILKINS